MTRLRQALTAIAATAVLLGLLLVPVVLSSDHQDARGAMLVSTLVIGWSFVGTGVYVWWRGPSSRIGSLMCLTGFSWLLMGLRASDAPGLFIVGFSLPPLSFAFLAQLLLSFPDGRLHARLEKTVVITVYLLVTVVQVPTVLFADTAGGDFLGGPLPENPLLVADDETAFSIAITFQALLGVATICGLIVALVRRRRQWNSQTRRAFAPVLWAGGTALAVQGVTFGVVVFDSQPDIAGFLFVAFLVPFAAIPYAYLAGLLQTRISQADAVGDLITSLIGSRGQTGQLVGAMTVALDDPSLEIAYWVPDISGYVDPQGLPVPLPADRRRWTPVEHDGRPIAVLLHGSPLENGRENARRLAAAAALNLENERLEAELRSRVRELGASRARVVEAGDAERTRVERNLHDGAQQRLVSLALNMRMARTKLDDDPAQAAELLDQASKQLEAAIRELRELARGIHPAVLTDRGLPPALDSLVSRSVVPVELTVEIAARPAARVEAAAYYVVAESLTNVARHADASIVEVIVRDGDGELRVSVRDDGRGGADPGGSGLRGLADRVGAADGTIRIGDAPGGGTVVEARLPVGEVGDRVAR